MTILKRTLTVLVMAMTAAMTVIPAQAAPLRTTPVFAELDGLVTNVGHRRYRHRRHYRPHRRHRYRRNNGAAIAGALIGGAIIGGVIANSNRRHVEPRRVYRGGLSQAHIRYCYNRYRSYRASDNTFQPYGNRRRQQCRSRY